MTVTLSYDAALSRVEISATGLAGADVATIERSTDQIRWTLVRGATELDVDAGALADDHYDYEFVPGVANYYRVRGIEQTAIAFRAQGTTAVSANAAGTATVSPDLPVGVVEGDLMLLVASIRNKGVGSPGPAPTGWLEVARNNNLVVYRRRFVTGDGAPTVTYVAGVANATITGKVMAWQAAGPDPVTVAKDTGVISSQQNVPHLGVTVAADGSLVVATAWKQNAWTSVAPLATMTEIHDTPSTLGDDASVTTDYVIQTTAADISAGSWVVTGGSTATSTAMLLVFEHAAYLNEQIEDITPAQATVWLKSPQRPFLNQQVSFGAEGPGWEMERGGRGTAHEVLGRSLPVGQTEVAGSRRYQLRVRTETHEAGQTLQYLLESGDVMYLQSPAGATVPAGGVYLLADTTRERLVHVAGELRHWTVPVREVAAPGPDVAYALSTWATVLALYGTWADLLAANSTWSDVLELLAAPSEVVLE